MKLKITTLIESKHSFLIAFLPSITWGRSYDNETENIMFTWLGFAIVLIIKE